MSPSDAEDDRPRRKKRGPTLVALPRAVREGMELELYGEGWPDCPIELTTARRRAVALTRIVTGYPVPGGLRPDASGTFRVAIDTMGLDAGTRQITARSAHRTLEAVAVVRIRILPQPSPVEGRRDEEPREGGRDDVHKPFWRDRHFLDRRFGHLGRVPEGTRKVQIDEVRRLRAERDLRRADRPPPLSTGGEGVFAQPDPAVCNWTPVGAGPVVTSSGQGWAGRTLSIAIDSTATNVVYVGTANGGVWKTTNGGDTWTPKSDYQMSLAIGALAIDPNNNMRVFAGTGEYNNVGVGTYYGNGLLRSTNGGDTWTELAGATFERDEISRIKFDPTDATSQKMFLTSNTGVYESPNGGDTWTSLRAGSASDLVVFEPGAPNTITLIAAFRGSGLWTATRTGATWSAWTQLTDSDFPTSFGRIALAQSVAQPKTIFALFAGLASDLAGLVKTTDGGSLWTPVDVRLDTSISRTTSTTSGHAHTVAVPASDMTAASAAHTYTTSSAGTPAHTHQVSLTAAQFTQLQGGTTLTVNTDPDATGHQHSVTLGTTNQSWYNLHVAVHPTDSNTIFIGEVQLWRTTAGGGAFTRLTGLHVDHHAFAFDPVTPATVWACSDGGVFKSTNTGGTWVDRNRDLGTLQYISVAQHPQWESVLIGGTQDNGTHRYSGTPAWELSIGGDGGFTAIDSGLPTRMYHEFTYSAFQRSDSAGAPGSWVYKNAGITGGAEFYAPFTLDPSNANTCYFGGAELWRSANNADAWTVITSGVNGNITAIAVHPSNSNLLYIGTTAGNVYRLQKTGASWNVAGVTRTDLTGAPLPAGVYISDLAVDSSGTVWVTVGSVLWSEFGDTFANDHVYRRTTAATVWESRSMGLAAANPINTIVIDPADDNRLFCGGDLGVWRTNTAGGLWEAWDQGLPNVPVYHLEIHAPRRLVRAATHGRSIWERPIDVASCALVDLYVRDNVLDSGRVQPSPSGQPHPFDPSVNVYWWQSADIKVDALEPVYQTTSPIDNYVDFEFGIDHRTARRNRVNRFYVQVHNRGVSKATNVQVRAFFADASAGLPNLPADFWSSGKPFTGTPATTDWTPIGPTRSIPVLEPAEPGLVEWDWTVPGSAAQHSCLLAVVTCTEDPISAAGIFQLATLVPQKKHATLKNLHVDNPVPGSMQPEGSFMLGLGNESEEDAEYELVIDWGSLPDRTRLFLVFEKPARWTVFDFEDQDAEGLRPAEWDGKIFPRRFTDRCGGVHRFDLERVAELRPPKRRMTTLNGIRIPGSSSVTLGINVLVPKLTADVQFDVIQTRRKKIVGGSTYRLRPPQRVKEGS